MTDSAQIVRVDLGPRSYTIEIDAGNLTAAGRFVTDRAPAEHAVLITDEHVEKPHAVAVAESLAESLARIDMLVIEPGEPAKSIETAAALWERLLQLGTDRQSVVVAVGGGVVGDLAGFVAATFARGLRFVQVPTTLLAQVDSSVGGKVGINLPEAKNMVGAFHQPLGVLVDTTTLETLARREYLAGLGEVIKYGVILDAELFVYLESHVAELLARNHEALGHVIARCCRLKGDVVQQDEREESGLRAVLNYGHTFAHAFEALTGYGTLLHGEAVAMGMICASRLAERLGRVDARFTARQCELLAALGLPIEPPPLEPDQVLRVMSHDKKVEHGHLRFVLPTRMGHCELVEAVNPDDVRGVL